MPGRKPAPTFVKRSLTIASHGNLALNGRFIKQGRYAGYSVIRQKGNRLGLKILKLYVEKAGWTSWP